MHRPDSAASGGSRGPDWRMLPDGTYTEVRWDTETRLKIWCFLDSLPPFEVTLTFVPPGAESPGE